jgi:acetylornithine/succinyldiaminopimelate/putrescine aminotransferase
MTMYQRTTSELNSPATTLYGEFAKPYLAKLLNLLSIDRVYTRAQGDYLTDASGNDVLDLLGGYGSTLLGHNHPRLVKALCDAYAANVPTNVQGSVREPAARLAQKLNALFATAFPDGPRYLVHFSSTGTEAVEAAIKHALVAYVDRRRNWSTEVAKVLTDRLDADGDDPTVPALTDWKELIDEQQPVLLAVRRSYHGKTAGSLAATWNPSFKTMFDRAPIRTEFLDPDDIDLCEETIRRLVHDAPIDGLPRFCPIVGVIFEPMQCEGGMYLLPDRFIRFLERVRREHDVPLIADEIQSGFFRTGRFLCCEHFALQPDYVLLGKSLGGGLAKISATCIASPRYMEEFSWLHSSTFAEDEPSCIVALEAIDMIESLSPSIAARAERFESRMRAGVAAIQATVGPFVAEIRGKGFLIGLDFDLAGEEVEIPLF